MSKKRIIKVGETVTVKVKCKHCRNGNCKDLQTRNVLNNFSNLSFCGKTKAVLQYTKAGEA